MIEPTVRSDLTDLRNRMRSFTQERNWEQFHSPKNLAMALNVEASELLEPFQWLTSGERDELGDAKLVSVRHEMADVLLYLVRMADRLNIDLYQASLEKLALNGQKYPADMCRGSSQKYTEYKNR
ncbi:conserved hypothetical protein [Paraburkholderia ribeironis]|uniref:MazG nucleotide pyrophosphohydrolase n=1 Tax=Paraburkholderia ribeironis TaxID=1247936 RepID=A0A1N7S3Q3_9BURK|nr:nucleotide pyrophosphohydrolase [Paraburkholderia ribeironis]SIT41969.1 conserved hypothetical protein [Paraburkholderia ribeironis]